MTPNENPNNASVDAQTPGYPSQTQTPPKRSVVSLRRALCVLLLACVGATFSGCAEFVQYVSVGAAWCDTNEAADRWATAFENAETFDGVCRAYDNFYNELNAIDLSDCPPDFLAAFRRLLDAVDNARGTLRNLSGANGFDGALEGVATALLDDPNAYVRDALNELELLFQKYCA